MIKTGSTKAGLPKPGHQERSKQSPLSPGSSPNTSTTMRTSRSSHTLSSDQRQSKLKRSNSDDALTKPGPGVAAAAAAGSRMKKTVTIGAISDLAENRPRSLSGVPGLRKSGIPSPRDGPSTTTRDRLSLREQLKTSSSTKRLVSSASASGLSTATKPTRGTAKSQRQDSQEKSLLEVQMKELLAEAKLKDVEIGNLKEELDRCREKVASLASSSPHAVEDQEEEEEVEEAFVLVGELREKNAKFQRELAALREENQGLKEKLINLQESPQSGLTLESNDPSSPVQTSVSYSSDITKGSPSPDSSEFEKIPSCSESLSSGGESVKKLEEQIHKMEESHHSTSEELQATLQELSDQQQVLQELTSENERLAEEKRLLQTSLQQHRERVEVLAQKNEALTGRIQEQAGKEEQEESRRLQELEQKYAELVENSLFEREKLVDIQQQLTGSLRVLEKEHQEAQSRVLVLQEEKEKLQERESSDSLRVENSRLRAEVDAERQKVLELLSVQSSGDGAELLLKTAHTERGSLEAELSELREGLLQVEDQQVQAAMSKVEAKCRQIQGEAERREVELFCRLTSLEQTHLQTDQQVKDMKETIFELEDQVEQQRAVNLHTNQNVIDLENLVKRLEEHKAESEQQLKLFTRQIKEEKDEWRRFQADLQTAVVVANDIKVEAQHELRTLRRQLQEEQDHNAKLSSDLEALQGVRINSATFDTKTAVEGH